MNNNVRSLELLPVVWAFGWVILLLVFYHLRTLRRRSVMEFIHRERIVAMEKGIPLPEMPPYEERRPWGLRPLNPRWPLGLGAVSITTGIGACIALRLSSDPYNQHVAWPMGIIAVFFGVGLFLHYFLTRPAAGAR